MKSINGLDEMITEFSFGKIVVNGKTYTNDIKIVNGQVISEWWRKRGHRVAVEDITDVLEAVEVFNKLLLQDRKVAAGFHISC